MSDWTHSAEDAQADEFAPPFKKAATRPTAAVLPVLQNWQVLDVAETAALERDGNAIDGEATVVTARAEQAPQEANAGADESVDPLRDRDTHTVSAPTVAIPDELDPTLIVTLDSAHCQVVPGEAAHYTLTMLNNGRESATYRIVVEGWIVDSWLTTPLPPVTLARGARQTITVSLTPLRAPQTVAGERALAFVVRRVDDAMCVTRRGATLTILPYTELALGHLHPSSATLTPRQKHVTLTLPITNRSNYPVAVRLQPRQSGSDYSCTVTLPQPQAGEHARENAPQQRRSTMIVAPGKTITTSMQISAQHQPLFAFHQATTPLQLITSAVALDDRPYQPWSRTITIPVTTKPLIGLWQLTSVVGLLALTIAGMGVAGLVALLLFSMNMRPPAPVTPPVSQVSVAPQPIIVAYIQAPVPASASQGAAPAAMPSAVNTPIVVQPRSGQALLHQSQAAPAAAANAPAPILSVDQVSAPGSAYSGSGDDQAAVVAGGIDAASRSAPMTYGTMFQEIAQRYALDWRILAAQAYVESSFDSVALGAQGDLGLMQIQPATWREWAPTVEAADPFDSYSNVLVAATYVDYLRTTLSNRGHPELEWTLVAYNWGIDKVLQHLESGQGWQELAPARQAYATEILRLAATIPAGE